MAAESVLRHYAKLVNLHAGVVCKVGARGRGLFASQRIAAGTQLLAVPPALWITQASIRARAPRALVAEVDALSGGDSRVAAATLTTLALLSGEAESAPYVATLPAEPPDVPSLWPAERLAALDGSPARNGAEQFASLVGAAHKALRLAAPERDYLRLSCLARSRALSGFEDDAFEFTLVPALDLANHDLRPTAAIADGDGGAKALVAVADLEPGDEVTISYGPLSNAKLLRVYGFALENNPHDAVVLARSELCAARRRVDDAAAPVPGGGADDVLTRASPLAANALRSLRAALLTTEDAVNAGARGLGGAVEVSTPVSLRNERACLDVLRDALLAKLRAYPAAPDDDADALAGDLAPWERHAVLTRLGEMHIILGQLEKVDQAFAVIGR